jgi:4,5-dihydroxyphthalate decarboxylase
VPPAASPLRLTFACGLYDRVLPLYTGDVRPEGIDLDFLAIDNPREIFDRMAGDQAFDASEMSISEMITRISARQCPFVAIPVFPSRCFRHGFITVNRRTVRAPKDLAGKRIGVALYTQTAAVFMRGLLAEEYGVDLSGVHWVEGAINEAKRHGHPTVLPVLRPVTITANDTGRSLSDLLAAGEIDAILGTSLPVSIKTSPDVVRLFPDFREREKDYYRRTRIFPIMHTVAIRRDVHAAHPFVAHSLFAAFCAAKDFALGKMRYLGALRYMLPWLMADVDEIDEVFAGDPWPYGIEPNRPTLEAAIRYLHDQGMIAAPLAVEDVFQPLRDGCRF